MKKKHRVKSKFRFCLFLTIIFVISITTAGNLIGCYQAVSMTKPEYEEITIIYGDTLWELAKEYGPKDQDVRRIVYEICRINNTSATELSPGQMILIPKYM